jgi:Mn-dependent DtxR family transcriptional regulator
MSQILISGLMTRGPDREVTLQDVWDLMKFGEPETTSTLAEKLPCHPDTVYNRLTELESRGYIEAKEPSAKSRVWWKPTHNPEIDPDEIDPDTRSKKDPRILRVLAEAKRVGEPLTSDDIAQEIGETQDITYNRLRKLRERGWLESLKAGSTAKVWWLADLEGIEDSEQTSLSLSPALKDELKQVRDSFDEPQNLEDAVIFAMKYPDITDHQLNGRENDLRPIKVSKSTREHLQYLRETHEYADYEAVIRDNADIAPRKSNHQPVVRTPPSERTSSSSENST